MTATTTATVEGAGVELAYSERGEGTPVLLIHDLGADAAAWEPVVQALAPRARTIAYDRRGYGASGAPEPYERTTVYEQSEDARLLLLARDATPALVCGQGLGALVALDLLHRHGDLVRAAVLGDPPLLAFVPEATELLSAEQDALREAVQEVGPAAAVQRWLDGRADAAAVARARRAHRAFFADLVGVSSWPITRAELRALVKPAVIVTGPASPPQIVRAADVLAELMPAAERRTDGDLAAAVASLL